MQQILLSESYNRYQKRNHNVGIQICHFEWCTKYQYKMFGKDEYRNFISVCIRRGASLDEIKMIELNVHLF